MGITVGHDPDMGTLLNMSYVAGLGNFNRWQAEYQQRSDMQNAQLGTQASMASAGHQTQANLGQENMYSRMYQAQYNQDMKQQLAMLQGQIRGQNQLAGIKARGDINNPIIPTPDNGGAGAPGAAAGAGVNPLAAAAAIDPGGAVGEAADALGFGN